VSRGKTISIESNNSRDIDYEYNSRVRITRPISIREEFNILEGNPNI